MAVRMVSRFYLTYVGAVQAIADLAAAGAPQADISLIESEDDARLPPDVAADAAQSPASTGAKLGGGIGGGLGALVGVEAIAVPGLDPAALGWFAPILAGAGVGAALGAVVGVATRMGTTTPQAHSFAAGLRRGEFLVMVRARDGEAAKFEAILARAPESLPPEAAQPPVDGEQPPAIPRDEQRTHQATE